MKMDRTLAVVADPVGAGFVASLARPGGMFERDRCEVAGLTQRDGPRTTRVAVIRDR